ncbi:hypothetical protein MKX03_004635 [Papaver bracteatum]|nr:hypothetical protein MKX03_004635 [Papaver bracteatum]
MASLFTTKPISNTSFITIFLILNIAFPSFISSQSSLCTTSCGDVPIEYPFSIDAGCGSPYFRHIFSSSDSGKLDPLADTQLKGYCDSSCDSASYLCRHLPNCPFGLGGRIPCCSYYPKATDYLRLMLQYCTSYTSVYWRNVGALRPYDQVPEYGSRINYEIPITTSCLQYHQEYQHHRSIKVIAVTATGVSFAGAIGIGAGIWYIKKL